MSHAHVTPVDITCVRHSHVHVTMCTSLTCTRHSHVHVTMCMSHVHVTCGHMLPALQALEKERDVAEDRLKIEQTQRDSIEKLRQRNKELEKQLRELCDSQVCMCVCLHV